ncbi:RRP12-like protein [Hondaea fermentalgiana]|uniref:RRP12-like protein n=1 Tax=Hondaea fermentalgiana TaxID=2315210 RepID=A0A2R5GBP2_9STRA|nr:RRP12-like protein [Hondaea fermentalgiana]|eukprot:GBG28410.1 RRP12-like protein [Hondaea fermentalgiana]
MSSSGEEDVLARFRGAKRGTADDFARSAAIEALTEVIMEQRTAHKTSKRPSRSPPTATEYFASIMMALEGSAGGQLAPLMFLLSVSLPAVPRPVLRLKGEACVECVQRVLRLDDEAESDDSRLARYCLTVLGSVLSVQEPGRVTWDKPVFFRAFTLLVHSTADERPKLRKVAQQACETVLKGHDGGPGTPHKVVCQLTSSAMKKTALNECASIMRLLSFVTRVSPLLVHNAQQRSVFEVTKQLTRVLSLGHITLSTTALHTLQRFIELLPEGKMRQGDTDEKQLLAAAQKETERICQALAHCMVDTKQLRHITNDAKLCGTWVATVQRAESLRFQIAPDGTKLDGLSSVADAYVNCISAGMRLAADHKLPPLGQPQVALSVGALTALIKTEAAQSTNTLPLLEAVEPLLGPQFEESWPLTLEVLRAYFTARDEAGLAGANAQTIPQTVLDKEKSWLRKLANVREAAINPVTGADKPRMLLRWRGAMERLFATAIAALGPEIILDALPLETGGSQGVAAIRLWLVPLLRENIGTGSASTRLAYFRSNILSTAEKCERASQDASLGPNSAKAQQTRFMQLWSLLPGFCLRAEDIDRPEGLRALAPVLGKAMTDDRYPELVEIVCQALQNILAKVDPAEGSDEEKKEHKEELEVVRDLGRNFLPLLFNQFDQLMEAGASRERADHVLRLISVYALAAPSELVNKLFRQLVQQLLEATQALESTRGAAKTSSKKSSKSKNQHKEEDDGDDDDDDDDDDDEDLEDDEENAEDDDDDDDDDEEELDEERRKTHSLTSLALALVPALDDKSVTLLYRVVQPYLQDEDEPVLQKRAYRVLEAICQHQITWTIARYEELIQILQSSFHASSAGSRTTRLKTMRHVTSALASDKCDLSAVQVRSVFADMLGEVVLCTKETNTKARTAGYKLIVEMAQALESAYLSEEGNETGTGLRQFLHMSVGGLAAQTPHMRSAAVNVCSRLIGEFHKIETLQKDFVEVAQTALMLLKEKSREVVKSCISLAKVCAIRLPPPTLSAVLPTMIENLVQWMDDTKSRFKLRIRVIFERLIKRVGPEPLLECSSLPPDHKLLTYIRKQASYKRRRYERRRAGDTSVGVAPGKRRNRDDEDDSGDDEDDDLEDDRARVRGRKRRGRGGADAQDDEDLVMDEGGEALDLLGASALSRVKARAKASNTASKPANGDDANNGLPSEFKMASDGRIIIPSEDNAGGNEEEDDIGDARKRRRYTSDSDSEDEDGGRTVGSRRGEGAKQGLAMRGKKGKRGQKEAPGAGFKSSKSGGDVKKKSSKFEPYAYIKLDPKLMNHRRKHEAAKQFRGLSGKRFKLKEGKKNRNK